MTLSERYVTLIEKKYKPMVWEDINFGDVVWISTENWNKMWTGNRSVKRYPSDDYMKKLQSIFVNKTLGKVMDVYDNGSADVKFNDKTFRLKVDFVTKLESGKEGQKEPIPITESITDEPEQEEEDLDISKYFGKKVVVMIKNAKEKELINSVANKLGWEPTHVRAYPFYLNISGHYSSQPSWSSDGKMLWGKEVSAYTKYGFRIYSFDKGFLNESITDEPEEEEVEDVAQFFGKKVVVKINNFKELEMLNKVAKSLNFATMISHSYPYYVNISGFYKESPIGKLSTDPKDRNPLFWGSKLESYRNKFKLFEFGKGLSEIPLFVSESIADEPEEEEESILEKLDKYIYTETVVEIKNIQEFEKLIKAVSSKLTFNKYSGRSYASAKQDLKWERKLYVSLRGSTMSENDKAGFHNKALNYIPDGSGEHGYEAYKDRGYKIIKLNTGE